MLISLVKKDFLLIKKDLLILFAFAIGAPIFISSNSAANVGIFSFFLPVIIIEYILTGTIWKKEYKYKGAVLFCTTPYTRKTLVKSEYLFVFIIFICNYIIYALIAFITPFNIPKLSISGVGIVLLIVAIFFNISIPVLYKFGYVKLSYILPMIVVIIPFGGPYIIKFLQANNVNFNYIMSLPKIFQNLGPYVITLIITLISMMISINIYSKKDL